MTLEAYTIRGKKATGNAAKSHSPQDPRTRKTRQGTPPTRPRTHGGAPQFPPRFTHETISRERGLILQCERALREHPQTTVLVLDLSTLARYTSPIGDEFPSLDEGYAALVRCAERHNVDLAVLIDGREGGAA